MLVHNKTNFRKKISYDYTTYFILHQNESYIIERFCMLYRTSEPFSQVSGVIFLDRPQIIMIGLNAHCSSNAALKR